MTRITAETIDAVDSRSQVLTGEFARITDQALKGVDTKSSMLSGEFSKITDQAIRAIEARGSAFTSDVLKITEQSVKVLDTRGTAFTQEVTRITDQSIKTLDGKGSALTGEVARATDAALGAIEAKGTALARAVLANSDEIVRLITQASGNATAAVGKSLSELEDKAKLAIEKSQRTSTSAVAEMLETHSMLRNDTSALFDRLREANSLLQDVLGGANESLGRIESTLSVRVKEFVSALSDINERSASASDHVEQQIKSFHVLTAGVLTDISSMAERFEEQGRALTTAATNLDQAHHHIEATLGQRHEALTTVVGQLGSTTENLDQRFNRFSMLLQESLSAAENRAREIARVIADSSTEGTRAIAGQYELVRSTSEEERQRTLEALRTVFETTASETQTLFHAAGDRFKDVVKEMRESAATMQRELETTREELRRGILELPQDTAESTAQMRRVIVEQMDALAELNRIVARHGRTMDTVEPTRSSVREERSWPPAPLPDDCGALGTADHAPVHAHSPIAARGR